MQVIVGKTAFIDLSKKTVKIKETPRRLVGNLLGGRGANMAYLYGCYPKMPIRWAPKMF